MKNRGKWLEIIGFGKKKKDKLPNLLKYNENNYTYDADIIKQSYYQAYAPFFQNQLKLLEVKQSDQLIYKNAQGIKPAWWNTFYHKNAKNLDGKIWDSLMEKIDINEIENTINDLKDNLAPDMNGNNSTLLKSLFYKGSILNEDLCDIYNKILEIGDIPENWKKFYLIPIPKNKDYNDINNLKSNNRPISILHDYYKVLSRILAKRLNNILLNYRILHPSILGFIKEGSINQCLVSIINVFEDSIQKRKIYPDSKLFCISYDFCKAYDNLQFYSIKYTLERFNMPNMFIKLIENIMFNMKGQIKTFYGFSNMFNIKKSLRQGDPLAPLIFVLFTDALHYGIQYNPLLNFKNDGYSFLSNNTNITSIGFADDLVTFSENWEGNFYTFEFVKQFIWSHGGDLNADKIIYIISNAIVDDTRHLVSNDGKCVIYPKQNDSFRYLGLWLNINLDWTTQINKIKQHVIIWCNKIVSSKLPMVKAIEVYKMMFLPMIDIALTFSIIDENMLKKWNRQILTTLYRLDGWKCNITSSVSSDMFYEMTNVQSIQERYWGNKIKEFIYNINSINCDYNTAISRLSTVTKVNQKDYINFYETSFKRKIKLSHYISILNYLDKYDIRIKKIPSLNQEIFKVISTIMMNIGLCENLECFTDGSTIKNNNKSGIGIYFPQLNLNYSFMVMTHGNNYMAEVMAIAISMVAMDMAAVTNGVIYTDSKSTIEAIGLNKSRRQWIRTSLRGC